MKYKDYYATLGVERDADDEAIKKAYRRLARKYHPDVSKETDAEERFKEVGEAYETLKDPEKRRAYDELGRYGAGQEFRPPPGWSSRFTDAFGDEDLSGIDLGDVFEMFRGARPGAGAGAHRGFARRGHDYEVTAHLSLEEAAQGTELAFEVAAPEHAPDGSVRRVTRTVRARIPKGATDGQKLRVPGRGGPGLNGGPPGDLYISIALRPHHLFRVAGHDLYLDLPVTPWEAALGAGVEIPTLRGKVNLRIPSGSRAGQKMRLAGKGLPKPHAGHGDLYAMLQIVTPGNLSEEEERLYEALARASSFNPRAHFG